MSAVPVLPGDVPEVSPFPKGSFHYLDNSVALNCGGKDQKAAYLRWVDMDRLTHL